MLISSTPWQLEGNILGLESDGFQNVVAVHNNTGITDPFRGGRLNKLESIYQRYDVREKYVFAPRQNLGNLSAQGGTNQRYTRYEGRMEG